MACVGCGATKSAIKSAVKSVENGNIAEAAEKAVVIVKYTASRIRGGRRR